jgi:hypothetical protein
LLVSRDGRKLYAIAQSMGQRCLFLHAQGMKRSWQRLNAISP